MEKNVLLEELRALIAKEDPIGVNREVGEVKVKFEDYIIEEERKHQIAQLEAQDRGETIEDNQELADLKETFYSEYKAFKEKRKAILESRNAEEALHLSQKKALISKLKDVIENEENIGAAFGAFKEIQESWKKVGDIPRDKRDSIQAEYSKLLEDFFYNIKIYKELKEHDFHRNAQLKEAVISKLTELKTAEPIKDVEGHLKTLQNEWEDIGPVPNEDWERLKEQYWSTVRVIYDRINEYYDARRATLTENIAKKNALIAQMEELVSTIPSEMDVKHWDSLTKKVLELQAEWKTIGFGPKKDNEVVWKAFRSQCDAFFERKKEFYNSLQTVFSKVAEKKQALIDKAKELQQSTDWKTTSEKLIQLQKQWKQLGHAGQRNEQKLWKAFREACDSFFNSKQQHFAQADAEYASNGTAKKALIEKIEGYEVGADKKQVLADLKQFAADFNAIGKVPMKEKDSIYNAFKSALDKLYASIKLEGQEKEKVMYQAKLDMLAGSPDADRAFYNEKQHLRSQIDKIKSDIIQYENNLGFFANSKGADALKKEVQQKIDKANELITELKNKIKLIPNE